MKKSKNSLLLLFLFYMMLIAMPAFASMKNEPDGFRGIPWRTKLTQDGASSPSKWGLDEDTAIMESSVRIYGRKNEKMTFGGAEVFSVNYFFHKSLGFAKVHISAEGYKNFELIRRECMASWGEPDKEDRVKDKSSDSIHLHWCGRKVIALLVYDKGQHDIALYIYLNNYHHTVRSEEEAQREAQENS